MIEADIPEDIHLSERPNPEQYGELMAYFTKDILEGTGSDPRIMEYIRQARYSFLFGEDGEFLAH